VTTIESAERLVGALEIWKTYLKREITCPLDHLSTWGT